VLNVNSVDVASFSFDFLDVVWTIDDTNEDVTDFDFFVERSEAVEGPFDLIAGPLIDEFRFRDVQAPRYHRSRQFFYRIKTVERATGKFVFSNTGLPLARLDLVSAEIQKSELIAFKEFTSRKVWIFPRRTFGQKCPACYDPIKDRTRSSRCLECFGTGFARGFLRPIESFITFSPETGLIGQSEKLTERGREQHNIVSIRAFIIPLLKAGDMIVEVENARWRVTGAGTMQHLRHPVTQHATVFQMPDNDIEFAVPIKGIDPVTFQAAPKRAFTNYANIDAAREGDRRSTV